MGTIQSHAHAERKKRLLYPFLSLNAAEGCHGGHTQSLHFFPEEDDAAG